MKIQLLIVLLLLNGCTPVFIGTTATATAVSSAHDRRTVGTFVDDNANEIAVATRLFTNKNINDNSHINVTVYNGKALLTGEVRDATIAHEAEMITRGTTGIRSVNNFLVIGRTSTFLERTYDTQQTAKVKTALLDINISGFDLTRVKVVTEHGITYLMGILKRREAETVANHVRQVTGVKKVVTLFDIR